MIENIVEKIQTKQQVGQQLIDKLINAYTLGKISDEQFLPVVKAIYDNGLSDEDLFYLTNAMMNSGEVLDLSCLGKVVDKHSTGGVSDTTTLILVPVCACLGVTMFKMSGRALGFTGGTCDKLECFAGYKTDMEIEKAINLAKQNGGCMITSSMQLAPADKKIYALRDRTGLVDNIPLIASSIMSKKLASGASTIVLDVKYGNGAFMPTLRQAKLLAQKMETIGKLSGKKIKSVFGKMDEPLGYNIGPRLETLEAIEVLNGKKGLLYNDSVKLASWCVALYKDISYLHAKLLVKKVIKSGKALEKLKQLVSSQGGSLELFSQKLPAPTLKVLSQKNGKFYFTNTKLLGQIVADLTHECGVEFSKQNFVGVKTMFKNKATTKKGDCLFEIYCSSLEQAQSVSKKLQSCYDIM